MGLPDGTQNPAADANPCNLGLLLSAVSDPCCGACGPDNRRVLDLSPKGLSLRWVISFLNSEKYLSAFFVQAGPDDDDRLDHLGHGGGLVHCTI